MIYIVLFKSKRDFQLKLYHSDRDCFVFMHASTALESAD